MNFTSVVEITSSWTEVLSGPTSGNVLLEIFGGPAIYVVSTSVPSVGSFGHQVLDGEKIEIVLDDGQSIFFRLPVNDIKAGIVKCIATNTLGFVSQGIDNRVYSGRFRAITIQPLAEANSKNGTSFEASAVFNNIAPGAKTKTVFKTGSKTAILKSRSIQFNGASIVARIYKNPSYSGGNSGDIFNQNSINPEPTTVQILSATTVTSDGIEIAAPAYAIGSEGQTSHAQVGTERSSGGEYIFASNSSYLFVIENNSAAEIDAISYLTWYEGPING